MRPGSTNPARSELPDVEDSQSDMATRTFLGKEVTEEESKRYGQTLAQYFEILYKWAQEKGS